MKDPWGAGTVPYLDYIIVNTLIVILSYSFARCYHWGKLVKGTQDLYYFLKLQMKLQLSKNKRFKFFKNEEHATCVRHLSPQEKDSQGKYWVRIREMLI